MLKDTATIPELLIDLIETEVAEAPRDTSQARAVLDAFQAARVKKPFPTTVQFSGGLTQTCWTVTRPDGDYRVVYLPRAGYFSLCVESDFGPLDVGVHGPAIGCFSSV